MTVYGLSKATGISRRHISKIEAGQSSPTADKIIAIKENIVSIVFFNLI